MVIDVVREMIKNDVPELWRQRARAGFCPVCGKTQDEFEKMMRVYCSHKCRDEYAKKYTHWAEVRDKILERDENTCKKCGINVQRARMRNKIIEDRLTVKWIKENRKIFEHRRDEKLVHLSKQFEEEYNELMDDNKFIRTHAFWKERNEMMKGVNVFGASMEVDHIEPVALGGDMWDEENMQTLCEDCHKKKTKKDMKKIRKVST